MRRAIYTGLLSMLVGTLLEFGYAICVVILVLTTAYFAVRIRSEEPIMEETFGDEDVQYRRRVKAILPLLL